MINDYDVLNIVWSEGEVLWSSSLSVSRDGETVAKMVITSKGSTYSQAASESLSRVFQAKRRTAGE